MARRLPNPGAHDIAAEIIRRAALVSGGGDYVVRLSKPPTWNEQLQLLASRLERRTIVIMPHKCESAEEWMARYGGLKEI